MRILHAPTNSAGTAFIISRIQRRLGHVSDVLVFRQTPFNYECDFNLELDKKGRLGRHWALLKNFWRCFFKYDIFHFHFGQTLLPYYLDLPILKLFGKKIFMQYWGYDCLQTDIAPRYTLLPKRELNRINRSISDKNKRERLKKIACYANATIVGSYSLLPFSLESLVVPQAFELEKYPYVGAKNHPGKIRIVHAPTSRIIKGTKYILKAIIQLKKEGYLIELTLIEKKSHSEAVEIYKNADIIIDEVNQGPYGMLAIECMALGKPVLCYVDEHFRSHYHDLPIINTNPKNIAQNLITLIKDPKLRERIGQKGRLYIKKHHDADMIAKKLIKIYRKY